MNVGEEVSATLVAEGPGAVSAPQGGYIVRRLTPGECCRLQGFPDGWCEQLGDPSPSEAEIRALGGDIRRIPAGVGGVSETEEGSATH